MHWCSDNANKWWLTFGLSKKVKLTRRIVCTSKNQPTNAYIHWYLDKNKVMTVCCSCCDQSIKWSNLFCVTVKPVTRFLCACCFWMYRSSNFCRIFQFPVGRQRCQFGTRSHENFIDCSIQGSCHKCRCEVWGWRGLRSVVVTSRRHQYTDHDKSSPPRQIYPG